MTPLRHGCPCRCRTLAASGTVLQPTTALDCICVCVLRGSRAPFITHCSHVPPMLQYCWEAWEEVEKKVKLSKHCRDQWKRFGFAADEKCVLIF